MGRLAVLLLLLDYSSQAADNRALAREHFIKGTKAFDLGAMDEAVGEYMEAYRLRDDPALLYNIAQAQRQAGRNSEALRFYKVYLTKVPRAANRSEVVEKIAELQKSIEQQRKTLAMPPDQPIAPAPSSEPSPMPEVSVAAPLPAPAQEPPRRPRRMIIAGTATAAVGLALAIGGIAALGLAQANAGHLANADQHHLPYDPSLYSAYHNQSVSGGALLGLGAVTLVVGAAVAILGARRSRSRLGAAAGRPLTQVRF